MILPNSEVSDSVQLARQRDKVESSISCRGPQRVIHLTSEHQTPTSRRPWNRKVPDSDEKTHPSPKSSPQLPTGNDQRSANRRIQKLGQNTESQRVNFCLKRPSRMRGLAPPHSLCYLTVLVQVFSRLICSPRVRAVYLVA